MKVKDPIKTRPGSQAPKEIEATLAVVSDDPYEVVDALIALSELPAHILVPTDTLLLNDIYFDTEDGRLKEEKIALRLRRDGLETFFTLKGPATAGRDKSVVSCLEIERPWSEDAPAILREILAENGVRLAVSASAPFPEEPSEAMATLGLIVIQDRENLRRVRAVVEKGHDGAAPLAEMVIDTVTYRIGAYCFVHHEVEVEALACGSAASVDAVKAVASALKARFEGSLRRWNYGKLMTGAVLQKMQAEGKLGGPMVSSGNLKIEIYEQILKALEEER